MTGALRIRPAEPGEEAALMALCVRSKARWGYDADFMAQAMSELTVHRSWIDDGLVLVAERHGVPAGVAALADEGHGVFEISVFFVEPDAMGQGIGAAVFDALMALARARGATRVTILSDPNAEPFYRRMGAVRIGEDCSSSETGRTLPLLEFRL